MCVTHLVQLIDLYRQLVTVQLMPGVYPQKYIELQHLICDECGERSGMKCNVWEFTTMLGLVYANGILLILDQNHKLKRPDKMTLCIYSVIVLAFHHKEC